MAESNSTELLMVKPEILAEWRGLGNTKYVWRKASLLKGYRRWAAVGAVLLTVAVIANRYFHWWPTPEVENEIQKILVLIGGMAFLTFLSVVDARKKIAQDKQLLLQQAGLQDVDPDEVGLVGQDKPYILIA